MKIPLLPDVCRRLVLLLLLAGWSAGLSQAATPNPPQFMAYQSYLTDQNGNPLGSTNVGPKNYNVVFRIWDIQNGGATNDELYAEQQTLTVNNGFFSVLLGQGSAYSNEPHTNALSGLFAGSTAASRFVEMTVLGIGAAGANITILPRAQLLTSPYAFLAANAVSAANATSASSLVNNNNTTVLSITNSSVGIGVSATASAYNFEVGGTVGFDSTLTAAGLANLNGGVYLNSAAGYHQSSLGAFNIDASGIPGGRLTVTTGGAVGIGTASPGQPLEVNGNMYVNGQSDNIALAFDSGGSARFGFVKKLGASSEIVSATGNPIIFSQSSSANILSGVSTATLTERMRIDSNGNVGIGAPGPDTTLMVSGSWAATYGDGLDLVGNGYGGAMLDMLQQNVAGWGIGMLPNQGTLSFVTGKYSQNQGTTEMVLTQGGNLGLGTIAPNYPIEVESYANYTLPGSYGYLNNSGASGHGTSAYTGLVSIYAGARIVSNTEFDTVSDARIKEIVSRSDTRHDLATVRKLQITDYRKKDKVQFGGRLEKGVIAQEVEAIVPEAVSTSTNFLPNIYAVPRSFATRNETLVITMSQPHGLTVGDVVKLMTETGELKAAVASVESPLIFAVARPSATPQRLFVFGKQVGDFRTVNYDRLYTTGLGAIQELAEKADEQNARVAALEQEVSDLKKLVGQLAEAAKAPKMTAQAGAPSAKTMITASLDR